MKAICELEQIKGDAYEYYIDEMQGKTDSLFEKIFLVDELLENFQKPEKYLIIGEKGSGKTAYAVYLATHPTDTFSAKVKLVENTIYNKFVTMKQNKSLDLSTYKDIWLNIIYLILCEELKKIVPNKIWNNKNYKALNASIDQFYSNAFRPEFVNAIEFIDKSTMSINSMIKNGVYSMDGKDEAELTEKYVEQSYELSLMKLQQGFEKTIASIKLEKNFTLFIDGIDARPDNINNAEYLDCLKGLVNAVISANNHFLRGKNIKVALLIRPDILYSMSIHNLNQKIRDNAILLNWVTTYNNYKFSKLYKIADNYLAKQQNESYNLGECWEAYFPYKIKNYSQKTKKDDDAFIGFLRYSLYKPRDILTMLNELQQVGEGNSFKEQDFKKITSNYSIYLKGELKDYMLIYMSESEYTSFYNFFDCFKSVRFSYDEFVSIHQKYIESLRELSRPIPYKMGTPAEALQLLYDTNIICYEVNMGKNRKNRMYWSYKERNYSNIQPEVKRNASYRFHMAYARAFKIV